MIIFLLLLVALPHALATLQASTQNSPIVWLHDCSEKQHFNALNSRINFSASPWTAAYLPRIAAYTAYDQNPPLTTSLLKESLRQSTAALKSSASSAGKEFLQIKLAQKLNTQTILDAPKDMPFQSLLSAYVPSVIRREFTKETAHQKTINKEEQTGTQDRAFSGLATLWDSNSLELTTILKEAPESSPLSLDVDPALTLTEQTVHATIQNSPAKNSTIPDSVGSINDHAPSLLMLPDEILEQIILFLDPKDRLNLSKTSNRLHSIVANPEFKKIIGQYEELSIDFARHNSPMPYISRINDPQSGFLRLYIQKTDPQYANSGEYDRLVKFLMNNRPYIKNLQLYDSGDYDKLCSTLTPPGTELLALQSLKMCLLELFKVRLVLQKIIQPTSLKALSIRSCDLTNDTIADTLSLCMPDLKQLDLSNNKLKSIPKEILILYTPQLTKLDLSGNYLFEDMSTWDGFTELPLLKELNLSRNRLQNVPNGLKHLTALEKLDLSHNELFKKISTWDEFFTGLPSLTELDVSNNSLNDVPSSFKNLNNLKILFLGDNPINPLNIIQNIPPAVKELDIRRIGQSKYCQSSDDELSDNVIEKLRQKNSVSVLRCTQARKDTTLHFKPPLK